MFIHEQQLSKHTSSCIERDKLVFIDSGLKNYPFLVSGAIPSATTIVLDADQDGVTQITEVLHTRTASSDIYLVAHGAPGCLYLGNTRLNLETLEYYSPQLQQWFQSTPTERFALHPEFSSVVARQVSQTPKLFLYACNVAAGDAGTEFLEKLHNLLGVAIAASTSRIGTAALGGKWELDVLMGPFSPTFHFPLLTLTTPPFTPATLSGYDDILRTTHQ